MMYWDGGWHGGGWWWLAMLLMMIVFWGGVAWVVVTLIRHSDAGHRPIEATRQPSGEEILHERLARGEIEVDEYTTRLNALRSQQRSG